jgi:5-methylcytosine-specific restriction endonuclease McrA
MGTTRRQRIDTRRRRRVARADNDLTVPEWHALLAAWGGCAYCGVVTDDLQRDCVLAISRGGRYTVDNVVPACQSCNASKCNSEVTAWMRRKRLDERTFLVRQLEIAISAAARAAQ